MKNKTCCACGESGARDVRVDKRGTTMPLCPVCEKVWRKGRERVLRTIRGRKSA